jgi:hypothetical protein
MDLRRGRAELHMKTDICAMAQHGWISVPRPFVPVGTGVLSPA